MGTPNWELITEPTDEQWKDARKNGYKRQIERKYVITFRGSQGQTEVNLPHFQVQGATIVFGESLYQNKLSRVEIFPLDRIDHVQEVQTRYLEPFPDPPADQMYFEPHTEDLTTSEDLGGISSFGDDPIPKPRDKPICPDLPPNPKLDWSFHHPEGKITATPIPQHFVQKTAKSRRRKKKRYFGLF